MLRKNIIRFSVPFLALMIMTGCMDDPNQDEQQLNEEEMMDEEMMDEEMMENGENETNPQ